MHPLVRTLTLFSIVASPALALDANHNGMSDVWESFHPTAAADPGGDPDGDGIENAREALAWTDPFDATSYTRAEHLAIGEGRLGYDWQPTRWMRFRPHQGDDLKEWSWSYVPETGNTNRLEASQSLTGSRGFSRLQVLPSLNSDTDALDNLEEERLGTDPEAWDTDGDRVADDVEFLNGTDPLSTRDADGDTLPDDWEEWIIRARADDTYAGLADVNPGTDFDEDRVREGQEFALGTSPVEFRRNIILFLTEDQSYHLGCLGTRGLDTPRLDAMGNGGLIFTRAFAAAPVCSPAKMAIYTGTHPHHNSGYRNVDNYPEGAFPLPANLDPKYNDQGVHEDLPTFVEILADRGWFTAVSHKVHVEPVRKYPYHKGYGQPNTPTLATDTINNLIPAAGDRPFFMMFNIGSPHLPFRSLPNNNGQWSGSGGLTGDGHVLNVDATAIDVPACYPDVPAVRQDIADYYGAIEVIDSIFGAMMDALSAKGALENTLVVFSGDHGIGLHRAKQSCYGLGLHVPLLMSGPGMSGGRRIGHPVSHVDLAPTFLDFAGLPTMPSMTGRSLLPILSGAVDSFEDRPTMLTASHHRYDARAVCDGRYYYIRNLRNVSGATLTNPAQALNADSYQSTSPYFCRTYNATVAATGTLQRKLLQDLVEGRLPVEELYDMDNDLWMTNNLAGRPDLQGKLHWLRGEMDRWRLASEDYMTSSAELIRRTKRYDPPGGGGGGITPTNTFSALANFSFEVPEGGGSTVIDWTESGGADGHFRIEPNAAAPDGAQIATLGGLWSGPSSNGGLTQLSTLTIEPGTYTLTFEAASVTGPKIFAALYAGTASAANYLATTNAGVTTAGFSRFVLEWNVGEADPHLGRTLGVQFMSGELIDPPAGDFSGNGASGGEASRVGLDRVILDYEAP